jgi:hypothetical protein
MKVVLIDEYVPSNPIQTKGGILYDTYTRFGKACDVADKFVNRKDCYEYDSAITSIVFIENYIKANGGSSIAITLGGASHAGWCANYISYNKSDNKAVFLDVTYINLPIGEKMERLKYLCVANDKYLWDICRVILIELKPLCGDYYGFIKGYPEIHRHKIITSITRSLLTQNSK